MSLRRGIIYRLALPCLPHALANVFGVVLVEVEILLDRLLSRLLRSQCCTSARRASASTRSVGMRKLTVVVSAMLQRITMYFHVALCQKDRT